jgi:hypothetical protein
VNLTYQNLKDILEKFTAEQLACNVSVYIEDIDEIYPVFAAQFNTKESIGKELNTLDSRHPILFAGADEEFEDPSDYVGMGWVGQDGRP